MLLLIVLPPVFKVIEKSLSEAGQDSRARQIKRMRDTLFGDEKEEDAEIPDQESCHPVFPPYEGEVFPVYDYVSGEAVPASEPVDPPRQVSVPPELLEGGYMSVKEIAEMRKAKQGEHGTVSGEHVKSMKIDPRKLVLYSEIMKTKF